MNIDFETMNEGDKCFSEWSGFDPVNVKNDGVVGRWERLDDQYTYDIITYDKHKRGNVELVVRNVFDDKKVYSKVYRTIDEAAKDALKFEYWCFEYNFVIPPIELDLDFKKARVVSLSKDFSVMISPTDDPVIVEVSIGNQVLGKFTKYELKQFLTLFNHTITSYRCVE